MKIRIVLRGAKNVELDFTSLNNDRAITPRFVRDDMARHVKLVKGLELGRWEVKRSGERWKGMANEEGPPLREGDVVVFKTTAGTGNASEQRKTL